MTVVLSGGKILGSGAGVFSVVSGVGAPQAPTNFQLTNQGLSDSVLTWNAAIPGAHSIDHYKIYRNGSVYDTSLTTTYTDSSATNVTTPGFGPAPFSPATPYAYTVSAVDTVGAEGPQQTNCFLWIYRGGTDFWTLTSNSFGSGFTYSPSATPAVLQPGSPACISLAVSSSGSNWEPYSGQPFLHNMSPTTWAAEVGGFNYISFDMMPTTSGTTMLVNLITRITTGDNFNSAVVTIGDGVLFGPASVAGQWATYKIPLLNPSPTDFSNGKSAQMGFGTCTASIVSQNLVVTANNSGINVQGSAFLSGTGILSGTTTPGTTYVGGTNGTSGQAGTYPLAPASQADVASQLVTMQRTNLYKFSFFCSSATTVYMDNWNFSFA